MEVHDEAHPVTICVVRPRAKPNPGTEPEPRLLMLWGSVRCVKFAMYFIYGISFFSWTDNSHTLYISHFIVCSQTFMHVWVDNYFCEVYGEESYDQQHNSFFWFVLPQYCIQLNLIYAVCINVCCIFFRWCTLQHCSPILYWLYYFSEESRFQELERESRIT